MATPNIEQLTTYVDPVVSEIHNAVNKTLKGMAPLLEQCSVGETEKIGSQNYGTSISKLLPVRTTTQIGDLSSPQDFSVQPYQQRYYNLTAKHFVSAGFSLDQQELTYNLPDKSFWDFSLKNLSVIVAQFLSDFESKCFQDVIEATSCTIDDISNALPTNKTFLQTGRTRLDYLFGRPGLKSRVALLPPDLTDSIINNSSGLFNPATVIGKMYEEGTLDMASNFKIINSQTNPVQELSTFTGTITVKTQPTQNVDTATGFKTIVLTGFDSGSTLKKGDTFRIQNVFAAHPFLRKQLPFYYDFLVAEDVEQSGGDITVTLANNYGLHGVMAPDASGKVNYQDISSMPVAGANVSFTGKTLAGSGTNVSQGLLMSEGSVYLYSKPMKPFGPRGEYSSTIARDGKGAYVNIIDRIPHYNIPYEIRMYPPERGGNSSWFQMITHFGTGIQNQTGLIKVPYYNNPTF